MDDTTPTGQPGDAESGPAGSEWPGADTIGAGSDENETEGGRTAAARDALAQLQGMIDSIATHAAPVARQIGAKAAELAAVAGDRAGPLARRAADVTEEAGARLAERSRALADELRREPGTSGSSTSGTGTGGSGTPAAGGEDRLGTRADNPAEGARETPSDTTESLGE